MAMTSTSAALPAAGSVVNHGARDGAATVRAFNEVRTQGGKPESGASGNTGEQVMQNVEVSFFDRVHVAHRRVSEMPAEEARALQSAVQAELFQARFRAGRVAPRTYRDAVAPRREVQPPAPILTRFSRAVRAKPSERLDALRALAEDLSEVACPVVLPASPQVRVPTPPSRERSVFWRVPSVRRGVGPMTRPTAQTWTHALGRRWVLFLSTRVPRPAKARYAVFGNTWAEMLYHFPPGYRPHPTVLNTALREARVWCGDMNSTRVVRPPFRLSQVTPDWARLGRHLVVADRVVRTTFELEEIRSWFRVHRPCYKAALKYLNGEEVDVPLLLHSLRRVVPPRRPAEVRSTPQRPPSRRRVREPVAVRPQAPGLAEVREVLTDVVDALPGANFVGGARVAAFLVTLSQQSTLLGVAGTVSQFAMHYPKQLAEQWRLFQLGAVMLSPQAPTAEKSYLLWDLVSQALTGVAGQVWEFVAATVMVLLGHHFLPDHWTELTGFSPATFTAEVRRQCSRLAVKTVAESLMVAASRAARLLKDCVKARSLEPLLTGYSPVQWCHDVHSVVTYYPELVRHEGVSSDQRFRQLMQKGLLPSGVLEQFTPPQMREYIDELFFVGERFQAAYRGTPIAHDIEGCMRDVRRMQAANSTSHSVMALRVQPFGVFMHGPPGSGKTNLASEIRRAIARRMGYPVDETATYKWQMNVNFQDGLDHRAWCVEFDDVDQNVAPPVATTDNHYTAVLKVVNNAPLPVEQSDVNMKGKICAKPLLAIYCSNFAHGRLKGYSLADDAFWRRLGFYLNVRAREGFESAPGSGILNVDKVRQSPGANYLSIDLYRYDPSVTTGLPMRLVGERLSKQELLLHLGEEFALHMEWQREFLRAKEHGRFCPRCYADLEGTSCLCGFREQAGLEDVAVAGMALVGAALVASGAARLLAPVRTALEDLRQRATFAADEVAEAAREARALVRDAATGYHFVRTDLQRRWAKTLRFVVPLTAVAVIAAAALAVRAFLSRGEFVLQQRVDNAAEPGYKPGWTRPPPPEPRPPPAYRPSTFTLSDIVAQVRAAYVRVQRVSGSKIMEVFGVAVGHNVVVTVAHILPGEGEEFMVCQQGITHDVVVSPYSVYRVGEDTVMIKVPGLAGLPSVFKKIWYLPETGLSSLDAAVLIRPDREDRSDVARLVRLGSRDLRVEVAVHTEVGDCGLMYAGLTASGWRLVAQHSAAHGVGELQRALGMVLTQHHLTPGYTALAATPAGVEVPRLQCSVSPQTQGYEKYPLKSEFWTAVAHHGVQAVPLGTANPRVHGATTKTRVAPTLVAEDFRDLEEEWCGERGYWRAPDFSGQMVDGKWFSPYTYSLIPLRRGARREAYYWLAVADYVSVFKRLSGVGYRPSTPAEAIIGIPGTVLQPVDLTTSVGMPFNKWKRDFMCVHQGEVALDGRIRASFEEMRDILNDGDLPSPVALAMLKDEQLKPGKIPRVFNCLPFAFNWLLRVEYAGLVCFERANNRALECFVGINMTSAECNEVVDHLSSREPTLTRLLDMDVSKQDKSEDGFVLDFVALVTAAKGYWLGHEPLRLYALEHALRNTVSVVKNDFFIMGAQNPSGSGRTVETNSVVNSLQQRYMYFRMKYPSLSPDLARRIEDFARGFMSDWGASESLLAECTFRVDCALATYGDDALIAVASHCEFYNPELIPSLGEEMGMVFTDARKSARFEWTTITEVQFLRRTFVWDEECGRYNAQLSRKSLAKMLVLAKRTELTQRDHAAVLMASVMRELAYYGQSEYESMAARVETVARKYGLEENPLLRVPPFSQYRAEIVQGTFSAWSDYREQAGYRNPTPREFVEFLLAWVAVIVSVVVIPLHALYVVWTRPESALLPAPGRGNVRLIVEGVSDARFYRICGLYQEFPFNYLWEWRMTGCGVVVTMRSPLLAAAVKGILLAVKASAAAILARHPVRLFFHTGARNTTVGAHIMAVALLAHAALLPQWWQIDLSPTVFLFHGSWEWWLDGTYNWECALDGDQQEQVVRMEWDGPCLSTEA